MEIALSVHFKGYHKIIKILSWYLTKNVAMFMKNSSYLRPLNTCQKHFETTLPNLGKYTVIQVFYAATAVYSKNITKNID